MNVRGVLKEIRGSSFGRAIVENSAVAWVRDSYRRRLAKQYWRFKVNPCENAPVIFDAIEEMYRPSLRHILEFGSSGGANLKYFLDRIPGLHAVGVDINRVVLTLAADYPNYTGIVGDEKILARFRSQEFDLAFTVSVLDHVPVHYVVDKIIGQLLRISKRTILLEPFIEGVHGDVSGKSRAQVKRGLEREDKVFARFSYLWNYDAMLDKRHASWRKGPRPLHAASLGPFYHLYIIDGVERDV